MSMTASAEDRLRRTGLVGASALAPFDGDDPLTDLLVRVRQSLRADTAVLLLIEPGGAELFAAAAIGVENEVWQGVRIPVGRGFAGRIAAEREPVLLEQVDESTVLNQLLWEKGLHTLLGVPLLSGNEVLGVLHVGTFASHGFTDEDIVTLQRASERVALAVQSQRSQAARTAAAELQRSLLPAGLPRIPALDMAARYVPGGRAGVAGDWYDVFQLPSGWLGLVIGDVVGRDLPAAVVMGRLRSALRSYALETVDPADALTRLDRKLQHFEPGMMATVLYATVEPGFERVHVSSAGHLAPVIALPGGETGFAELPIDPPIGVVREAKRQTTVLDLPPGGLACFYTDGLVERRSQSLDVGLDLLRQVVTAESANNVCAHVMAKLIGDDPPEDDVAVLALRRQDRANLAALSMTLPAMPESLKEIRTAMRRWLSATGADDETSGDLLLAVGEACTNSVEHAYGPAGGTVSLHLELEGSDVVATVRDRGRWRAPRGSNRGRGIMLMRKCCDHVELEQTDEGTTVTIRRGLGEERE
ncbi:SpoIIE family protein phosphatase [Amycolatopsis acidicola]|uniref:SpoIIE family protein phosphatase n=1 Tax=Amycolatopsis acidicola TaxID=2596893 RepID=A0A5N0VLZ5_9PSEU|nr:SpoIIE family protein phosphatase [Amycolatopsis acidicola]KAA9165641.1 SpoIIE family protein phosphatase [Amycolatopsis acidicola]